MGEKCHRLMQGAYERDPEILENLIRSLFNDAVSTAEVV
jgi:DNA-binding protein YbaB